MYFTLLFIDPVEEAEGGDGQDVACDSDNDDALKGKLQISITWG